MQLIKRNIGSVFLDCLGPLTVQIILYGYLFPIFGMAASLIGAVYLGSILNLFVQLGYTLVLKIAFDLESNRFIDYHATLPLPKRWLFGSYIVSHMIEIALVAIPLILGGMLFIPGCVACEQISIIGFICICFAMFLFITTFFLMLGFSFSLAWILDNIWPRILVPLWLFSAGLVPFSKLYAWWPSLGYLFLISPMTYCAEGLRSALLGSSQYIAWYYCILPLCIWSALNMAILTSRIYKRLDPV